MGIAFYSDVFYARTIDGDMFRAEDGEVSFHHDSECFLLLKKNQNERNEKESKNENDNGGSLSTGEGAKRPPRSPRRRFRFPFRFVLFLFPSEWTFRKHF